MIVSTTVFTMTDRYNNHPSVAVAEAYDAAYREAEIFARELIEPAQELFCDIATLGIGEYATYDELKRINDELIELAEIIEGDARDLDCKDLHYKDIQAVNPQHYQLADGRQLFELIAAMPFVKGSALKYMFRALRKDVDQRKGNYNDWVRDVYKAARNIIFYPTASM